SCLRCVVEQQGRYTSRVASILHIFLLPSDLRQGAVSCLNWRNCCLDCGRSLEQSLTRCSSPAGPLRLYQAIWTNLVSEKDKAMLSERPFLLYATDADAAEARYADDLRQDPGLLDRQKQ